jgi:hypothetical protein
MKKLMLSLFLSCAFFNLHGQEECCEDTSDFLFEFTTGYRQDQLKIHVTPPAPDAPVVSFHHWKNVDIFQGRLTFKAETCFCTYSRAYFNYGRLVNFGYSMVSPTLVLSPSGTHHEKGRVYDAEYAFGFSWYGCDTLRFTPLGGYTYHRQEFESHDRLPRTGPTTSADEAIYNYISVVSKQRTTWQGPFAGAELEMFLGGCVRATFNGQYVWAHYNNHGKEHEKYNQTYRYKQRSNGQGCIFTGELAYTFLEGWEALLMGGYQYWDVKGGKDRTQYSTINPPVNTSSHLHSAAWQSFEISAGLGYVF